MTAVSARIWDFDDGFDDVFDDDGTGYMGGYSPTLTLGPLTTGYTVGMGSGVASAGSYRGHGTHKAVYIPYAVPTPVPPILSLELALGNTQAQNNDLFSGNGTGILSEYPCRFILFQNIFLSIFIKENLLQMLYNLISVISKYVYVDQ